MMSTSSKNDGSLLEERDIYVIVKYETALPTHGPSRCVETTGVDTRLSHTRMATFTIVSLVRIYRCLDIYQICKIRPNVHRGNIL